MTTIARHNEASCVHAEQCPNPRRERTIDIRTSRHGFVQTIQRLCIHRQRVNMSGSARISYTFVAYARSEKHQGHQRLQAQRIFQLVVRYGSACGRHKWPSHLRPPLESLASNGSVGWCGFGQRQSTFHPSDMTSMAGGIGILGSCCRTLSLSVFRPTRQAMVTRRFHSMFQVAADLSKEGYTGLVVIKDGTLATRTMERAPRCILLTNPGAYAPEFLSGERCFGLV